MYFDFRFVRFVYALPLIALIYSMYLVDHVKETVQGTVCI